MAFCKIYLGGYYHLGVSKWWLYEWKKRVNYQDPFRTLSDPEEIDHYVRIFGEMHPECGEVMLDGKLFAHNLYVPRQALRDSMNRVHPFQRQRRGQHQIVRRKYNVHGPHHLRHLAARRCQKVAY